MTHKLYIRLTGLVWFLMGAWLLYKGLKLIPYGNGAPLFISAGLLVGFLKGKFVLSKSAARVSLHIQALPLPIAIWKVYAPSYWILIGSMMALGMLLNVLPVPSDIRGTVDIAIGAALLRGSFFYL